VAVRDRLGTLHQEEQTDIDCPICGGELELVSGDLQCGNTYCPVCRTDYQVRQGLVEGVHRQVDYSFELQAVIEFRKRNEKKQWLD
jgi:ssDNA-binding Zn-finger/Zn-ribbon topoisomerase 1